MRPKIVVSSLVVAVLVGAAAYGAIRFFAPATDHAIGLVPHDAAAYASVFLEPSTSQRQALKTILDAFPASDSEEEARELFETVLEEVFAGTDLDYETDVKPWLGQELAAFAMAPPVGATQPDGALILETQDSDKAIEAVDKALAQGGSGAERTYRDVGYREYDQWVAGVLEDFLVIGSKAAFEKAVDTMVDEDVKTLAERSEYRDALEFLPPDRLALFYVDGPELLESLPGAGGVSSSLSSSTVAALRGPVAAALYARDGELVLEDVVPLPEDQELADAIRASVEDEGLLPYVTGRAWAGIGVPNLGDTLTGLLDGLSGQARVGAGFLEQQFLRRSGLHLRNDFLSWMGDAAIYVQETDPFETLSGGVVIESTDPAASTAVLNRLHGVLLAEFKAPLKPISLQGYSGARVGKGFLRGRSGFSFQEPGSLHPVNVVADGDRIYVMFGRFATFDALNGGSALEDVLSFPAARESLGDGYRVASFLAVPPLVQVINEIPTLNDENWESEVRPNLLSISHVVFGSKIEDDRLFQRLVVRVH